LVSCVVLFLASVGIQPLFSQSLEQEYKNQLLREQGEVENCKQLKKLRNYAGSIGKYEGMSVQDGRVYELIDRGYCQYIYVGELNTQTFHKEYGLILPKIENNNSLCFYIKRDSDEVVKKCDEHLPARAFSRYQE
jgi:hypothetical protein